jgi:hypothetical protein
VVKGGECAPHFPLVQGGSIAETIAETPQSFRNDISHQDAAKRL